MEALDKDDSKDGMGTATGLIYVGGSHNFCCISTVHEVSYVCIGSHSQFKQVLYLWVQVRVFPDLQRVPILGVQEVSYLLSIELYIVGKFSTLVYSREDVL